MEAALKTGDTAEKLSWLANDRLLIISIFIIALIPLFVTPVLPFVDFYNHIARYYVLTTIDHDPMLQQNYKANWSILPNLGLDVIVTTIMSFLPQAVVPRLTIIMIFAVQYSGILFFNKVLTGRTSPLVALLIVPLLYSFILNWGFANFLLGLGLLFWAAGWWLQQRHRLALALPIACLMATAIFFVHGLAFALYGILVALLEIGLWRQSSPRRLRSLVMAMPPLLLQAIIPAVLFAAAKTSQNVQGLSNVDEAIAQLSQKGLLLARLKDLLHHRTFTILRVAEGPSLAFDIITLVAVAMLLLVLFRQRGLVIARAAIPALVVFSLLVVVVPPTMFGVGYVSDRMPLVLAMLFVSAIDVSVQQTRTAMLAIYAIAAIVALRIAAIALLWQPLAADKRDFEAVAAAVPKAAMVEVIKIGGDRLDEMRRRCGMYGPLLIMEHGTVGGLFANIDQQPLVIIGPLRDAIAARQVPPRNQMTKAEYQDALLASKGRGKFPYLLICNADLLTKPLPARLRPIAAQGRFMMVAVDR